MSDHTRLNHLITLRAKVEAEIAAERARLGIPTPPPAAARAPRGWRPPCGTEQGYQWHRHHERDQWPLPADDPCGCRAAHAAWGRKEVA